MNYPHEDKAPLGPVARFASAIMVCNPLLLLSPMCLLYGIYRAVTAPDLFTGDNRNTIFTFSALAIYVLMVCVTSTLLARKRIIPDATMLLILHAILFVAPFILISHGVFLSDDIAVSLGAVGISAGLAQLDILRRRLPQSFVSPRLVIGGALILAANFAAPMVFRHGLENDNETWTFAGGLAWNLILPALVAWTMLLPTAHQGPAFWSRGWFGPLTYFTWLAGTTVQLWTVAYVDDRALLLSQFTAPLWVLAWAAFRHANLLGKHAEKLAPAAALLIPAIGALAGLDLRIAAALFALNIPILALSHGRLPILALSGASLLGFMCCLPGPWMQLLVPGATRAEFAFVTLGGAILGCLAILRDSRAGFLGAIGVAIACASLNDLSGPTILNATIFFLYLHQLRWTAQQPGERFILGFAGLIWVCNVGGWEAQNIEGVRAACMVATVVATLSLRNKSLGAPISLIPPVCSILVLCVHPLFWSARAVSAAPSGLLPIAAGFALLTAGAWWSLRKTGSGSPVAEER